LGALEDLHQRYSDRVAFAVVYIKEAHPEDGWVMLANRRSEIRVQDPRTADERYEVAQTCALRLRIRMPVVIDNMDNEAARQYGGWPDRLYLIGRDGRIAWQGGPGPFGFQPELLEAAIVNELKGADPA
jgi:hypothetical protein